MVAHRFVSCWPGRGIDDSGACERGSGRLGTEGRRRSIEKPITEEKVMRSFKNLEVIRRVQAADSRGESLVARKPLYIEQNVFDVGLDEPIFRIFQLDYLKMDIERSVLTFVKAHPDVWGDPLENPLLKASYPDAETSGTINLHGVLDFYGLSWTKVTIETAEFWDEFSHGKPAIRIETTPRALLERLMYVEDDWFMLRYYMGLVMYEEEEQIKEWIAQPDFTIHLDSLGQSLACSLMRLRSCFKQEQEVRLLFSKLENPSCDWARQNIKISENLAIVPFLWNGVINSVLFGPMVSTEDRVGFIEAMSRHGISCPID